MLIPDTKIAALSYVKEWQNEETVDRVFSSLKKHQKRDWFIDHAYRCLPLVMGNQHGFVVKSLYDFEVIWDGTETPDGVKIFIEGENSKDWNLQSIKSHFGMGTFTIQTAYQLRTSPGINLMTCNPPNYFIDGIYHMTGVVETDNLRRDFTFNLKITRPHYKISIKEGDYIGCVMPYPRHFIDNYDLIDASKILSPEEISSEIECARQFGIERSTVDIHKKHGVGRRYWRGEDAYGNKFEDHQTSLDD